MQKDEIGVLILAAGFSSRMGTSKTFLKFDEKRTFIEKIIEEYTIFGIATVIVVLNENDTKASADYNFKNAKIITNYEPEKGRSSSIFLGVSHLLQKKHVFLQNIDNPFVNQQILHKLYDNRKENSYISPVFNNRGGHPILIPKIILTEIQAKITEIQNLKQLLQPFSRENVLINNNSILLNINTKKEYKKHLNFIK